MTPMIDVVFLLLVFFVWTASFQVVEHVLPSEMSELTGSDPIQQAEPPEPQDFDDIVIRIRWDGTQPNWSINQQPYPTLADIQQHLVTIADLQTAAKVVLYPEPEVPLGLVIEAYDTAKVAGFEDVLFAVNSPGR